MQPLDDAFWMAQALSLADEALEQNEVPVGAILVANDQILGSGCNQVITQNDPCAHAEIMALRRAGRSQQNYRLNGATLYVTLEPCAMCAMALIHARIAHLIYATPDLKTGAVDSCLRVLAYPGYNHKVKVTSGILAQAASEKLSAFFRAKRALIKGKKLHPAQKTPPLMRSKGTATMLTTDQYTSGNTSPVMHGNLYVISAPSGAGKSSLLRALFAEDHAKNFVFSVSHTTRRKRPGEIEGKDYYFVRPDEFKQLIEEGVFLEYAKVYEYYYGTSYQAIRTQLIDGKDVFLDIDWQGAQQVRKVFPDACTLFILPPSMEALSTRLKNRGQELEANIAARLQAVRTELSHCNEYQYLIMNDKFDQALNDLKAVVRTAALRVKQQVLRYKLTV